MMRRVLVGSIAVGVGICLSAVPAGGRAAALTNNDTKRPAAHVSAVSPSKGKAGTTVHVKGRNFKHVKKVLFGSTPAKFTVSSSKSLKVVAPTHARGTVDVRVVTAGKKSPKTKADRFTYAPLPGLAVTSVSPASGNVAGGDPVTIRGHSFSELSSVYFGSIHVSPVTFHSATELTVRAPARAGGSVDVRVVVGSRKSAVSRTDRYTYTASPYAISALPLPSGDSTDEVGPISCGAVGSCAAAGTDFGDEDDVIDFLATLSGGTWSRTEEPLPDDATEVDEGAYAGSVALSCPSAGSCIAVSDYKIGSFATYGVIDTLANGTWTAVTAPLPANAHSENPDVSLGAVTCLSSTSCRAVGDYIDNTDEQDPLVETLSGSAWTASSPTQPGNLDDALDADVQLAGLSCADIGSCAAFGYYVDSDGNQRRWFDVLSNGSWTATEAPLPSDLDDADDSQSPLLNDLSCGAAGSCVAVGSYDNKFGGNSGLIETLSNGKWTGQRAPLPTGGNATSGTTDLNSITCSSATGCEAVGSFVTGSHDRYGLIETLSSGSWLAIRAPLPANAAPNDQNGGLSSISCPASGACRAVGDYSDTDDDDVSVFVTLSGGSWRGVEASLPPTLNAIARTVVLTSVDCLTQSSCAASGTFDNEAGDSQGLLETSD